MDWIKNKINLGQMYENCKRNFTFEYVGDLKIVEAKPSCGSCTKVFLKGNTIDVEFKSDSIPKHLAIKQNFVVVTKSIIAKFEDGKGARLEFTVKIMKK